MPKRVVAAIAAFGIVTASAAGASQRDAERGPFLLVSLPALGTVTWRCDPSVKPGIGPGLAGMALGFRAFASSATDRLRFRAGRRIDVRRTVQPGKSVRFPYVPFRVQTLDVTQFTEAGTLRAHVTVDFVPHLLGTYCYPYLPPKVTVRVGPRI
jgi:hypothetical protein